MADKLKEYGRGRSDGLDMALRLVREGGIEALEQEIRFRGKTGINLAITNKELQYAAEPIKELMMNTMQIACISIVHDEFGFGEKRVQRFVSAFNKLVAYLDRGWVYWIDLIDELKDRMHLEMEIPDVKKYFPDVYFRPLDIDVWDEADLIDPAMWEDILKRLGFTEKEEIVDKKKVYDVYDERGRAVWRYKDRYEQLHLYDILVGIEYERAVNKLEQG